MAVRCGEGGEEMGAAYRYMSAWLYVMVIDAVNSGVSRRSGFCFSNRISCKHNKQ